MVYVLQIIPLSIILTFTAILQGMNKLKLPAIILFGAIILKLIGNHLFIPNLDVLGAAIASNIGLYICAGLLMIYLKRVLKVKLAKREFYIKLGIASGSMIFSVFVIDTILHIALGSFSGRIAAVIMGGCLIGIGAFVYLSIVAKSRLLAEKEWFLVPFGRKMAAFQLLLNKKK